ncbi:MAG: YfbK domain-containing protein [Planctomycetota bacterium]
MNRENAEKLLAALIFDDLDEASKAELTAYLETDDELRERLADMRMAVKVTSDAVQHGPEPILDQRRMKRLARLAKRSNQSKIYTMRYLVAAAAVLAVIALPALLMPSLSKVKKLSHSISMSENSDFNRGEKYAMDLSGGTSVAYELEEQRQKSNEVFADADSSSVREPITRISNSVISTEESLRSDKLYAKALRPEDTLGGIGGNYGGGMGGYGGGCFARDESTDTPAGGVMKGRELSFADSSGSSSVVKDFTQDSRTSDSLATVSAGAGIAGDESVTSKGFLYGIDADRDSFNVRLEPPPAPSQPKSEKTKPAYVGTPKPVAKIAPKKPAPKRGSDSDSRPPDVLSSDIETVINRAARVSESEGGLQSQKQDISDKKNLSGERFGSEVTDQDRDGISSSELDWATKHNVPGGKADTSVINQSPEVPILGDIPINGELFKRKSQKEGVQKDADGYEEKAIPYSDEINFPRNWKDISGRHEVGTKETLPADSLAENPVPGSEIKKQLEGAEAMGKRSSGFVSFDGKDNKNVEHLKDLATELTEKYPPVQCRVDATLVEVPNEDEFNLPLASRFKSVPVNPWFMTERDQLSTFALDVDTASYTLCRRYINGGYLPPAGAVRMEEFVNYFNYHYPQQSNRTFLVHAEAAPSPFADKGGNLTLLKVGVKARTVGRDQLKAAHLVFVVDTSASMGKPDRLPLVQQALNLLVDRLSDDDRVTLITCSNQSRLHLEAVSVRERDRICQAINAMQPSGSTNLLAGLQLGYATARRSFAPEQVNHVVLCSDGVANVGQTDAQVVLGEVAADRQQGITITCVGVGYGSYNDIFLESLANQGDGSYVFLDTSRQAQEVFVKQLAAAMHVVAKDARIQVSFNPDRVRRYRLIGYENRDIEDKRFRDDTIDAGEVGSGQCSTALYELELTANPSVNQTGDLGTVFVRYRDADTGEMEEISSSLKNSILQKRSIEGSPRFFLAAAASHFAEILRQSEHVNNRGLADVLHVAEKVSIALPLDRDIRELVELIRKSEHLPMAQ